MKYSKSAKNLFFYFLLVSVNLFISCKKEKPAPTIKPTKVCNAGYYGEDCSIAFNSAYGFGIATATESCNPTGTSNYTLTIAPVSNDPLKFSIVGLWETPLYLITCNINPSDRNSFTAPRQQIAPSWDIVINSGTLSSDGTVINYNYSIYAIGSSSIADACSGTIHK